MNSEVDFKALWNKTAEDMPDAEQLLKKAAGWKRIFRIKLVVQSVSLLVVIAIILVAGLNMDHRQPTTSLGLGLMIAGIVLYLISLNQLLPMLFKSDMNGSIREYLNQLIRIKRNHEFVAKSMIDIYFCCLIAGVILIGRQFVTEHSTLWRVCYYTIVIGLLMAAWVYSRVQEYKKTLKPLSDTIKKLEALNAQLDAGE